MLIQNYEAAAPLELDVISQGTDLNFKDHSSIFNYENECLSKEKQLIS